MAATVVYHAGRIARRQRATLDVDLTHAAMGLTMAAMLMGWLPPTAAHRLALAFAGPAAWFAWRAVRGYVLATGPASGHATRQAVAGAAMVYMLAAVGTSAPTVMSGMAMGSTPSTAWIGVVLLGAMAAVALWTAARLTPRLAGGCQLAMNLTATYMLAALI
jgi:hypothetical protein